MSSLKRTSSRITRLAARASPYHPSVTLYEENVGGGPGSSRRRRIVHVKPDDVETPVADLEDVVPDTRMSSAVADESNASFLSKKARKVVSPRKAKPVKHALDTPHPTPPKWREVYDTIKEMRSRIAAPVDTMGCDQAQLKEVDPKNRRFATLVSLMLSSQTKDEVTDAAVANLRDALGGSLTVQSMINADEETIAKAIAKVGFWRRKTQYLKQTAQRLRDDFSSDVPKTVDELCSLPGVGPKMAFLALHVAWNINEGIGVDVHVHRITNRLGWHRPQTKNPEETRLNLQSWLPKEYHKEINHLLVGFGQMICLPVGPRCDLCDLSTRGLCPSAKNAVKAKDRKVKAPPTKLGEPKLLIAPEEEMDSMASASVKNSPVIIEGR